MTENDVVERIFVYVFNKKLFPNLSYVRRDLSIVLRDVDCLEIGNNLEENEERQLYHKTLINNNNNKRSLDGMTILIFTGAFQSDFIPFLPLSKYACNAMFSQF